MEEKEKTSWARFIQLQPLLRLPRAGEDKPNSRRPLLSKSQKLVLATLLILSGVGYYIYDQKVDFKGVFSSLERLTALNLGVCVSLALLQVLFQASRLWTGLLAGGVGLTWFEVFRAFSLGQLINDFLPARAGDLAKVALLKRVAKDKAITLTRIAGGVFIADKLADICGLVFWSAVGGRDVVRESVREKDLSALIYFGPIVGLVVCAIFAVLVFRRNTKLATRVLSIAKQILPFLRSRYLILGLLFAVAAWFVEIMNVSALSAAIGHKISFSESLAVIILLNIGIAVPVSIANIGTFEAAMAFGLTQMGVPIGPAIAIATVHHIIQVAAVVLSAAITWISRKPMLEMESSSGFAVTAQDKDRAVQYYESLAHNYNDSVSKGVLQHLRERERRAVLSFAGFNDSTKKTMIDVGCGGGYYAFEAKKAGLWVCATDIAPSMIDALKDKVNEAYVSDMELLKVEKQYDIVVCSGALDFVLNPELALKNLSLLVAPGGRLVIQVPRSGIAGWIYRLEKRFLKIRVNLFSLSWFSETAKKLGLKVVGHTYPLPTNMVVHLAPNESTVE